MHPFSFQTVCTYPLMALGLSLEHTPILDIEMMKALCKELGGKFEIQINNWMTIKTRFNLPNKYRQEFG